MKCPGERVDDVYGKIVILDGRSVYFDCKRAMLPPRLRRNYQRVSHFKTLGYLVILSTCSRVTRLARINVF
jgi:hypothetical protein